MSVHQVEVMFINELIYVHFRKLKEKFHSVQNVDCIIPTSSIL